MGEQLGRIHRILVTRVYRDKTLLDELRPVEFPALERLYREERPCVRLAGGGCHALRREDLERLWEALPWYLRGFTRLPWLLVYRRVGSVQVYELAGPPDAWAPRVLGFLLRGSVGYRVEKLNYSDVRVLLERYPSLVIVSMRVSL
ncbi:MAG: DUF61 family protein [Crenarchaeota archaeon]|nr:DUF61 family protein [Thermoproteota archaeon]